MNDIDYFTTVVAPTVKEFLADRLSIRRAILACMVVQTMSEHYYQHNKDIPDKVFGVSTLQGYFEALRVSDWAAGHVHDIANGIKHVVRKKPEQLCFADILPIEAPNQCGIMRAGFPLSDAEIFTDNTYCWLLVPMLEHELGQWRKRLGISDIELRQR